MVFNEKVYRKVYRDPIDISNRMHDENELSDYNYPKRTTFKNEDFVIKDMLQGETKISSASNNNRKNNLGNIEGQVKTGYLPNTSKA